MNIHRTPSRYYPEFIQSPQPSLQLYQVSPASASHHNRLATAVFPPATPNRIESQSFTESIRFDKLNNFIQDSSFRGSLEVMPRELSLSRNEQDLNRRAQNTVQVQDLSSVNELHKRINLLLMDNEKLTRALAEVNKNYELYIKSEEVCKGLRRENEMLQRALKQKDEDNKIALSKGPTLPHLEDTEKLSVLLKEKNQELDRYIKNEGKFLMILGENEKLNDILVHRSAEFETCKVQWVEQEKNLRQEAQALKLEVLDFEKKFKAVAEESKIMKDTLKQQEDEMENLRRGMSVSGESKLIDEFRKELANIKEKFIKTELDKNQQEYENKRLRAMQIDNEDKIRILLEDMEKLTRILEEKGEENEKFKISEMELDNRLNMMSLETNRLNEVIFDKQREIDRLETSRRQGAMSEEIERYKFALEDSEVKIRQRSLEIEHYVKILAERGKEIQDLQTRLKDSQIQAEEIISWQERYTSLEKKVNSITEIERVKYQAIIDELENKISKLLSEIEKLNNILENYDIEERTKNFAEISQLKLSLQEKKNEIEAIYLQLDSTTREFERFQIAAQEKIVELENFIQDITQHNSELEMKLQIFRSESEKHINKIISENDSKVKNHFEEVSFLRQATSENTKNKSLIDELEKRLNVVLEENKKLNQLLNQSLQELKSRTQLQEKLELLIIDNERLNKLLIDEDNRQRLYHDGMVPLPFNHHALRELENKLNLLVIENEELRKKDNTLKLQEVDRKINLLVLENDKLNKLVAEKGAESQYWQERCLNISSSNI